MARWRRLRSLSVHRLSKEARLLGQLLWPAHEAERPRTRADCVDGPRPCPWVSCRYHLALDVVGSRGCIVHTGAEESCALDVAQRGALPLEAVAALLSVTRERVRQLQERALQLLARTWVQR